MITTFLPWPEQSLYYYLHSINFYHRDDPYTATMEFFGLPFPVLFNVFDTFTSYQGIEVDDPDCIFAMNYGEEINCIALNHTERTTFSSDGKNITSTCLYISYFFLLILYFLFHTMLDQSGSDVDSYVINLICSDSDNSYSVSLLDGLFAFPAFANSPFIHLLPSILFL